MDYEAEDKGALIKALLALRVCPRCRMTLQPVGPGLADVWGCSGSEYPKHSPETWYLPEAERE